MHKIIVPLVENTEDLWRNIRKVESYLSGKSSTELRSAMVELIRRGNNFICYQVEGSEDSVHFVPSKYIGYKDNEIVKHFNNRSSHTITGTETDVRLDRILGNKGEDAELCKKYHEYCLGLGIPKEKLTKRKHKFWIFSEIFHLSASEADNDVEVSEGVGKEVLHKIRERNRAIIKQKKASVRGNLRCEVCGFLFTEKYGKLGENFIEVHHVKPISEMKEGEKTRLEDLILICSNCHSMIHSRRKCLTIDELKSNLI